MILLDLYKCATKNTNIPHSRVHNEDYKGNRSAPPDELIPQFDLAKEATTAFAIPNIGVQGFEADDCLGTIAHQVKDQLEVIILTGDRDILQVLDNNISVALLKKGYGNYEVETKDSFIEKRGYHPKQFVDIKALTGDSSDHYPGVKGIGPKTAEKLILQYKTVENLLASIDKLKPAQRKKIESDRDILILSRKLAEIKLDVPLTFKLKDAEIRFFHDQLYANINAIKIKGMARILDMIKEWNKEHLFEDFA